MAATPAMSKEVALLRKTTSCMRPTADFSLFQLQLSAYALLSSCGFQGSSATACHVLAELMDAVAVPRAALQAVDVSVCVPPMPLDEVLSTSVAPLAEPASAWEPVWDLLQRCSGLDAALDAYAERIGQLVLDGVAERLGAYAPASWAVPSATNEQRTAPAWDDYVPGLAALLYVL